MTKIDIGSYDRYIVAFSGGKDSTACILDLLASGVYPHEIELWRHRVDGSDSFMDWPATRGYCDEVAGAFGENAGPT